MGKTYLAIVALISYVITLSTTYFMIPYLKKKQFGQFIREEGPTSHQSKAGTPTMGGIAIVLGIIVSILISGIFSYGVCIENLAVIFSILAFGIIGFIDDYNKISKKQSEGLTPTQKILLQVVFAVILAVFMMIKSGTNIYIPFKKTYIDIGLFYIPFVVFIEIAMANAVNLTDGLDGLASSTSAIVAIFFLCLGMIISDRNGLILCIDGQAIFGAALGFLMLNKYPARIFMGDTGSMAIGGALAATSIVSHTELLLPIAGLIFVIEALSVILQVAFFKKTGGKRLFRMAPIHHHFELGGWSEVKVVIIFTLFTVVCSTFGIISVL